MSLIFNNTEVDKVIYNNVELDKVIYNGVVVWEGGDEFVATVKTGFGSGGVSTNYLQNKVQLDVTAGAGGCTVTWDNETVTVPANTTQTVTFTREEETTSTFRIKGDFISFIGNNGWVQGEGSWRGLNIIGITKWYRKLNKLQNKMFAGSSVNFNLELPSHITDLNNQYDINGAFYSYSGFSNSATFTFSTLENYYTIGILNTSQAPSNATNNGDMWSINNYVIGLVASSSPSANDRTDTFIIPNGTIKLPKGLFAYGRIGGSTSFSLTFKLTGIQFPNENLITTIPESFIDGATSLTTISFPASVIEFEDYACRQGANSASKFNEITFNTPRNTPITFGTNAFYSKSAKAVNIYTDNNISVLNYDWTNFTPTFYELDRTTQIPILTTPTITRNDNIFSVNSITGAEKYITEISSGTSSSTYTKTETIETSNAPTNINVYDYVDAPTTQTMYYRIRTKCCNLSGNYARSSWASVTWSVAV